MRKIIFIVIALVIATFSSSAKRDIAPGEWQSIRSYTGITSIIPSKEKVYVVANGGMYSYDKKTKEARPLSTLDGLSPTAIEYVEYVESTKTLFIIHSDMTIDLLVDGVIFNDESIKDSEISGKKVNSLKVDGDYVYVSMDAGIVVYNTKRKEVLDTYIIGTDGDYEVVYNTAVLDGDIYALMADESFCLKRKLRICRAGSNANDYSAWETVPLPATCPDTLKIKKMDCASGHVLLLTDRGLYARLGDGTWVDVSPKEIIPDTIQVYKNKLTAITNWQVMAFHKDNLGDMKYRECWSKVAVYDVDDDVLWFDNGDGLTMVDMSVDENVATLSEPVVFDGPSQNGYYSIQVVDGEIYLTGNDGYDTYAVADYSRNGKWHHLRDFLDRDTTGLLTPPSKYRFNSAYRMLIDPRDKDHIFVPTWWGLHEFYKDDLVRIYDKSNSEFQGTSESSRCTLVECAWYDDKGNLFATNPNSYGSLVYIKDSTGSWRELRHNKFMGLPSAHFHLHTSTGIDIFTSEYSNKVGCSISFLDMNKTPFDATDDKTKLLRSFNYSEDGVMSTFKPVYIFGVEEDLKGDVWIATDQGPLIMRNVKGVFDNKETYSRPKITREDDSRYADYLLASDKVRKIQVDGKNRKWIATEGNGVFLVSPNGDKIIENFTTKNSPLLSNVVMDIFYEKASGVLYIMTDCGVLMYATDSSLPDDDFDNITVYPNPVRPDYDGPVEIKGLMSESNVRITDQRGCVIENGVSKGGTYRFSARRSDGSRLPTGVYNIFVTTEPDEDGMTESKHLKFAIIR